MTDLPHDLHPGTSTDTTETTSPGGMPRWVRVFLLVGLALVLLFVVGKLTGVGGDHGPGRHGGGGATPTSVVEDESGHRSPVDHGP